MTTEPYNLHTSKTPMEQRGAPLALQFLSSSLSLLQKFAGSFLKGGLHCFLFCMSHGCLSSCNEAFWTRKLSLKQGVMSPCWQREWGVALRSEKGRSSRGVLFWETVLFLNQTKLKEKHYKAAVSESTIAVEKAIRHLPSTGVDLTARVLHPGPDAKDYHSPEVSFQNKIPIQHDAFSRCMQGFCISVFSNDLLTKAEDKCPPLRSPRSKVSKECFSRHGRGGVKQLLKFTEARELVCSELLYANEPVDMKRTNRL